MTTGVGDGHHAQALAPAAANPPLHKEAPTPSNPPIPGISNAPKLQNGKEAWGTVLAPMTHVPPPPPPPRGRSTVEGDLDTGLQPVGAPRSNEESITPEGNGPRHPAGPQGSHAREVLTSTDMPKISIPAPVAVTAPAHASAASNPFSIIPSPPVQVNPADLQGQSDFSRQQQPPAKMAQNPARLPDKPDGPDTEPANKPASPLQLQLPTASQGPVERMPVPSGIQQKPAPTAIQAALNSDLELLQQMHVCTVGVLGFQEGQQPGEVMEAAEELCGQHGPLVKVCCYSNKQNRPFALVKMASAEAALMTVQVSSALISPPASPSHCSPSVHPVQYLGARPWM